MKRLLISVLAAISLTLAGAAQTSYTQGQYHGPFASPGTNASAGSQGLIYLLGPSFELPQVTAGGLGVIWTNGALYPDGNTSQGVLVAASGTTSGSGLALDASQTACTSPAYATCDIIYANSSGTVAKTTSLATATAAGNSLLAFVETNASSIPTIITYPYQLTSQFRSSTSFPAFAGACTGTVTSNGTDYLYPFGSSATACATTVAGAGMTMPSAGTLANLYVTSSAAVVGGSDLDVATVYDGVTSTGITCTIAASGTACHDTTHSYAVAAGDVIFVKFVTATSDTAANMSVAIEKH